jgi:hypothetical protein
MFGRPPNAPGNAMDLTDVSSEEMLIWAIVVGATLIVAWMIWRGDTRMPEVERNVFGTAAPGVIEVSSEAPDSGR